MNLKNNSKLQNTFGFQEQNSLWIPKLIFDNNPSGGFIENDEMSILFAQPKAEPETKFNFDLNEYQEFKGSSNPTTWLLFCLLVPFTIFMIKICWLLIKQTEDSEKEERWIAQGEKKLRGR